MVKAVSIGETTLGDFLQVDGEMYFLQSGACVECIGEQFF